MKDHNHLSEKKLEELSKKLRSYRELDFDNLKIRVNHFIQGCGTIAHSLKALSIPFEFIPSDVEDSYPPDELNIVIGHQMDLRIAFILASVSKEVYGEDLMVIIKYATKPDNSANSLTFGSYLNSWEDYTNISSPFSVKEFINLDKEGITWEEVMKQFPNRNYSSSGLCRISSEDFFEDDYDDSYDAKESYGSYSGTYAQDHAGLSDDFINDVLDGNPDAYWNID